MDEAGFDRYGGWRGRAFAATGRFRVEKDADGRWWFVSPDGHAFFSHGVQCVTSRGTEQADSVAPYEQNILARDGSFEAWRDRTVRLLSHAGLNTLGDWSELELFADTMPYTTGIVLSASAPKVERGPDAFRGRAHDFFANEFEQGAHVQARSLGAPADDPYCIGVFLDDEVPWAANFLMPLPYLDYYLYLDAGAPGKVALQSFFERRYSGDLAGFNAVWGSDLASFEAVQQVDPQGSTWTASRDPSEGTTAQQADRTAFRAEVAQRYFDVASQAMATHAPDVLNLGPRLLPGNVTPDYLEIASQYCDVVSINGFELSEVGYRLLERFAWTGSLPATPLLAHVEQAAALADKPILLSSFTYRAEVEGLNDFPPTAVFEVLDSQNARADRYEQYMRRALEIPAVVGAHWFQHSDQPAAGRFDGENSNFGIVDIHDDPYEPLISRMRAMSSRFHVSGD